jgi:ribosomal protein S27AE
MIWETNPHITARRFVVAGYIKKPSCCSVCGNHGKTVAHHDDYFMPIDVRWLCLKCHRQYHIKNGHGKHYSEIKTMFPKMFAPKSTRKKFIVFGSLHTF